MTNSEKSKETLMDARSKLKDKKITSYILLRFYTFKNVKNMSS